MVCLVPSYRVTKRVGGRGCPKCGSHDTEGFKNGGAQWCLTCEYRWIPCSPGCRGYQLDLSADEGPQVVGCDGCGVPNRIARNWPETHRALAKVLDGKKLEPVGETARDNTVST